MALDRITMNLSPLHGGSFTRLSLSGPVVTAVPGRVLRPWLSQLAFWSGRPIHVVLGADAPASWLEVWTDALAAVPERDLEVEFRLPRDRGGSRERRGPRAAR